MSTPKPNWLTVGDVRQRLEAFVDAMRINIVGFEFEWPEDRLAHLIAKVDLPESGKVHYHITCDGRKIDSPGNFNVNREEAMAYFRGLTLQPGCKYGLRIMVATDEDLP